MSESADKENTRHDTTGIRDASEDILDECDGARAFRYSDLGYMYQIMLGKDYYFPWRSHHWWCSKRGCMIEPNMATMLAFTSDIQASNHELQEILQHAVNQSFNRITIDGDKSTNDFVLLPMEHQELFSPKNRKQ